MLLNAWDNELINLTYQIANNNLNKWKGRQEGTPESIKKIVAR